MTSPLPSGLLLDQLMYRSSPSQAEFPSSTPRADFYQSVPHKDKSAFTKPTVGSKRIRESAQPPGAFAAPVQSAPAVIAAPLDHRTVAVTSPLSQPPAAYYPKQQPQWEAGVPRGSDPLSDTSSPVSPIDGGFGTDCSDDLDSGAESPSQTIQLAGGGRLRPQGSLYFLPSADGGVAPFLVQSATQMRPSVPGSVFDLSTGAEESVRPAASNWTSPYAASGPALTSPTVNPVSARVPTFFPRKLTSETSTTEQKQPDTVPSDPSSSLPSLFDYSDSAELSSLSSASPVPDSDGPVQSQSDGSAESDTDVESPLKRARSSPSAPGTDPTTDPAPQSCAGFKCRVCARALRTEAHLACHMGVHSGERPCECPTCGQGFKTAADLANHARTHSLEKPFECSACSKAFKRRWELTRHMRVHTQDARPFECAECGKFFQTKTTLASHMRIHSDDKPFGCSVCSKTFKRKGELTLHMRTHTGERPFKCPYCHKGFKQKGTLTQHLPTHTDHRPFTCGQCSSRFKHKSSLTRHVRCHKAAEALAAMGLPAQLRAQLQMRLELDVLKSESQPVDSVPADSQVLESDADWLEACLKSTLSSAPLLPLQDPELDPAPACFRCQIPFDSVADLAEHIGESHPMSAPEPAAESAVHTVLAPALLAPAPPLPAASAAVPSPLVAPSLRFEAVFGPRTKSTKSAITPKKQPKAPRPAHKPQAQASSPKSSGHFCSACGKHFKHKYSLTRHTAKHHNHAGVWALAACPMCPQSFDSASLLSRHMVSAHGPSRPSLAGHSVPVSPLSGSFAALASAHYSVPPSPAADLARTFLFDGEAANISC